MPEHKLLFCYIEKNSCSAFNRLFASVRSRAVPSQSLVGKAESWVPWGLNSPKALKMGSAAQIMAMLKDPAWHKAVFYRDPLERFVSALQSKCELGGAKVDGDGKDHCRGEFGTETATFEQAVDHIAREDNATDAALQRVNEDVHFRRQSQFCGGLSHSLRYYDTVEQLDRATSRDKVIALLAKVNVSHADVPLFDDLFPAVASAFKHNTNAATSTRRWFAADATGRATRVLVDHYVNDYLLFGIPAPDWVLDDLTNRKAASRLNRKRR